MHYKRVLKMRFIYLVIQIFFLYGLYTLGSFIQNIFHLMIPGSIIGMIILFGLLHIPFFKENWVCMASTFFSKHLTIFFVPATVGIMQYSSLLKFSGIESCFIVLLSTILVMMFSSGISQYISTRKNRENMLS